MLKECIFLYIDAPFHCWIRRAFSTTIFTSTNTAAKSIHHNSRNASEFIVSTRCHQKWTAEMNKRGTGTFTFELLPEHKNTRSMACSYSWPGLAKQSKSGTGWSYKHLTSSDPIALCFQVRANAHHLGVALGSWRAGEQQQQVTQSPVGRAAPLCTS